MNPTYFSGVLSTDVTAFAMPIGTICSVADALYISTNASVATWVLIGSGSGSSFFVPDGSALKFGGTSGSPDVSFTADGTGVTVTGSVIAWNLTTGMTATATLDMTKTVTAADQLLNADLSINSATAVVTAIDATAVQLTTARTAGTVNAFKAATTSLAGDLNSVVYTDFRAGAPTDGGGTVIHNAITVEAGHDAVLDLSAAGTGESDVVVGDNLASAFEVREAANVYTRVVTTNDLERVQDHKLYAMPSITTVNMADAAHTLVYGTAGAAQTKVVGNILFVDANSGGASEDLTLPAVADSTGVWFILMNTGGEGIVVKNAGGVTIITLDAAQSGLLACDGTTWIGFIGGVT